MNSKDPAHQQVHGATADDHKSQTIDRGITISNHDHTVTWRPSSLYLITTMHCGLVNALCPWKLLFSRSWRTSVAQIQRSFLISCLPGPLSIIQDLLSCSKHFLCFASITLHRLFKRETQFYSFAFHHHYHIPNQRLPQLLPGILKLSPKCLPFLLSHSSTTESLFNLVRVGWKTKTRLDCATS